MLLLISIRWHKLTLMWSRQTNGRLLSVKFYLKSMDTQFQSMWPKENGGKKEKNHRSILYCLKDYFVRCLCSTSKRKKVLHADLNCPIAEWAFEISSNLVYKDFIYYINKFAANKRRYQQSKANKIRKLRSGLCCIIL